MQWWVWIVLGLVLLCIELLVIDVQFYLVFLGVSAALVGLMGVIGLDLPGWAQSVAFAVLSLVSVLVFRARIYKLIRARAGDVEQPLKLGDRVRVPVLLEPGQSCRVDYRGSSWTARNVDDRAIDAGADALITNVDGLTLHIRAQN
jgi:membrane protein implicated in regulation of membrane protease activity